MASSLICGVAPREGWAEQDWGGCLGRAGRTGLGPPLICRGGRPREGWGRGVGQRGGAEGWGRAGFRVDLCLFDDKQAKVLLVPVKSHFKGSERYHFGYGCSRAVRVDSPMIALGGLELLAGSSPIGRPLPQLLGRASAPGL